MTEAIQEIFKQGLLGVIVVLFIYLYLNEKKKNNTLQNTLTSLLQQLHLAHYKKLDEIRLAQIKREQEVSKTMEEYGKGAVEAVNHTVFLAEELRRIYERKR